MALKQVFAANETSTTTSTIAFKNKTHASVNLVTFMCKGDFDGAHAKLQLGASLSSGTIVWNDIASTTLSASGLVNLEVADGYNLRAVLYGMSATASQSTSVDGWIAAGTYIR